MTGQSNRPAGVANPQSRKYLAAETLSPPGSHCLGNDKRPGNFAWRPPLPALRIVKTGTSTGDSMSHTTCTILQYAAFLRGHGYFDTELQDEIIATLEARHVEPVRLHGRLATVQVLTRAAHGAHEDSLVVTLDAQSNKQLLQVAVSDKAGQALVRKLWHAVPREETEILIWTIDDDGSDAASECGLQYATVRQSGKDLRGTDAAHLCPLVDAAQAPFVAAGVTDKATLRIVEVQAILHWHLTLLDMTIAKFATYSGKANELPAELNLCTRTEDAQQDDDPFGLEDAFLPVTPQAAAHVLALGSEPQENPWGL